MTPSLSKCRLPSFPGIKGLSIKFILASYDNNFFVVPPDPVVIFDETGTRRTTFVGPYLTGDSMTLVCDAFGGKY